MDCRAKILTIFSLLLILVGQRVLAAIDDLIIHDFSLVRNHLIDGTRKPVKNLLGRKAGVIGPGRRTAMVYDPILLFLGAPETSFVTEFSSDKECISYDGYQYLELTYRFVSKETPFRINIEACDASCQGKKCDSESEIRSYSVPQSGAATPSSVYVPIASEDGNDLHIKSVEIGDFEEEAWIEILSIKLKGNGNDQGIIQNEDVVNRIAEQPEEYIVDDFVSYHRLVRQQNYHGHYSSDDWTNTKPAAGTLGALWLVTKPGSYWYTSLAAKGDFMSLKNYTHLVFYVRFPLETPKPFNVTISSGDQRSSVEVSTTSNAAKINPVNTWQKVKIPLVMFAEIDRGKATTLSISGFKDVISVQFGPIKFVSNSIDYRESKEPNLPARTTLPIMELEYTKDGTCGMSIGGGSGIMCPVGDLKYGPCCSAKGVCGDSAEACGAGCQSGYGQCIDTAKGAGGVWQIFGDSGVSTQHSWIPPFTNRIIFSDRQQDYETLNYAGVPKFFSVRLYLESGKIEPISQVTNAFCSGGAWLQDNSLVMVGGHETIPSNPGNLQDGINGIRILKENTDGSSNFIESDEIKLTSGRWYPTAANLPDNRIFIISGLSAQGRNRDKVNPTWEIFDMNVKTREAVPIPWIMRSDPYQLYPYVYVMANGRLFIRAGIHSIKMDHLTNSMEELPDILLPGQNYPKTGSSVMLPLSKKNNWRMELIFCGGSTVVNKNYFDSNSPASNYCAQIDPMGDEPSWDIFEMPTRRVMGDGLMLPDGKILWINGAKTGSQGYWAADNPAYAPDLYDPKTKTWTTLAASNIERLYHSIAHLLPDGRVLVSGSTPNDPPLPVVGKFKNRYEVEIFTPPYLVGVQNKDRPLVYRCPSTIRANGDYFWVGVENIKNIDKIAVRLIATGFVTHSVHMNERTIELSFELNKNANALIVEAPPNIYIAVPGPYMLFILDNGIPSIGKLKSLRAMEQESHAGGKPVPVDYYECAWFFNEWFPQLLDRLNNIFNAVIKLVDVPRNGDIGIPVHGTSTCLSGQLSVLGTGIVYCNMHFSCTNYKMHHKVSIHIPQGNFYPLEQLEVARYYVKKSYFILRGISNSSVQKFHLLITKISRILLNLRQAVKFMSVVESQYTFPVKVVHPDKCFLTGIPEDLFLSFYINGCRKLVVSAVTFNTIQTELSTHNYARTLKRINKQPKYAEYNGSTVEIIASDSLQLSVPYIEELYKGIKLAESTCQNLHNKLIDIKALNRL